MSAQDESSKGQTTNRKSWVPWSSTSSPPPPDQPSSRTATPNLSNEADRETLQQQQRKAFDHVLTHRHRLSLKEYPRDCPPIRVQWFHAVDVAKRRPQITTESNEKTPATPKKYAAFSKKDSKALEAAYQKLAEEEDTLGQDVVYKHGAASGSSKKEYDKPAKTPAHPGSVKVPVNEDYLFDVDVESRELGPAYWTGPIYDVRRGTWFYQEGNVQRPCDENLAAQLEEGYLKTKPWQLPETRSRSSSASQTRTRPTSWAPERTAASNPLSAKSSNPDLAAEASKSQAPVQRDGPEDRGNSSYRLFGSHMGSVVTYSSATTAWLSTDDFMSRMNYGVYQRFGGGGHFGGVKLTRGFTDTTKKTDIKDPKAGDVQSKPNVPSIERTGTDSTASDAEPRSPAESRRQTLERHMSYLLEDPNSQDPAKQEEEQRLRDELEIEDDYREAEGDDQGREIEHLILVTHGIGQRLGLRLDSVNFVHDVNMLRKTMKAVYSDSPDLRALNAELDNTTNINSRIQVLPICWRHLLDFPRKNRQYNRAEHDLADAAGSEYDEYPSLSDISVEGVPVVRNLISDLALDILLYQSTAYKDHITDIVLTECNRIYNLFIARNPDFRGKVSMIGHSLGSAIMFDILCRQGHNAAISSKKPRGKSGQTRLDFEVFDFYALGSPIGLFEMLNGRGIQARSTKKETSSSSMDDPMFDSQPKSKKSAFTLSDSTPAFSADTQYSQPQCDQVFNIFHPTDPIAYRLEPLVSKAMASMKPQPLPYTKRGIFGAPVGQGLTGIGARVGQSMSSFWSSMSSGLASSLLTRGLGYADDAVGKLPDATGSDVKSNAPLSLSAGTNVAAGVVPSIRKANIQPDDEGKATDSKQAQLASDALVASARGQHLPTLIDQDLETLSSGYEKRRQSLASDSHTRDLGASHAADLAEIEARGKHLRKEEQKVRKLNSNGRIDYAIQEGAFDINLLAAIASHLSYWGDEDVSHFMISQLLSRSQFQKRTPQAPQS